MLTWLLSLGRAPARKGRHGGGAGAVARHERAVDVAVGAPPARLLRRRAAAAAAAAAEPVPGDAIITRGVVVCPAGAVVPADGLVGKTPSSDHHSSSELSIKQQLDMPGFRRGDGEGHHSTPSTTTTRSRQRPPPRPRHQLHHNRVRVALEKDVARHGSRLIEIKTT